METRLGATQYSRTRMHTCCLQTYYQRHTLKPRGVASCFALQPRISRYLSYAGNLILIRVPACNAPISTSACHASGHTAKKHLTPLRIVHGAPPDQHHIRRSARRLQKSDRRHYRRSYRGPWIHGPRLYIDIRENYSRSIGKFITLDCLIV